MGASTNIYPRAWNHDALTHVQLEAVVRGFATTRPVAQGILDRRVGVAAYRDERAEGERVAGRFVWRISLSPLGAQLRGIEKARRIMERRATRERQRRFT